MHIEGLHSAKLKEEKAAKPKQKAKGGKSVKMDLEKVAFGSCGSFPNYKQKITCKIVAQIVYSGIFTSLFQDIYGGGVGDYDDGMDDFM